MVALTPLIPLAGKAALALGGGGLTKVAIRSLVSGAAFQAGAEIVAQIAEWARSIDGNWDSSSGSQTDDVEGCREVSNYAQLYFFDGTNWLLAGQNGNQTLTAQAVAITKTVRDPAGEDGRNRGTATIRTVDYGEVDISEIAGASTPGAIIKWRIGEDLSDCIDDGPGFDDLPSPLPLPPIESGDCTINVNFMGFLGNEDGTGNLQPVFSWSPQPSSRASGGVIVGECNFQPTITVGGGGDGGEPPRTIPNPPGEPGSDPWWQGVVAGIVGGLTSSVVTGVVNALLNEQGPASFTLVAPCDVDEEGKPLEYTVDFPQESAQDRILRWQMAQAYLLQQHLNWKTPICRESRPQKRGTWISTHWRSDADSPNGTKPLRKLFRYRSESTRTNDELQAYWSDFEWTSGNVCVIHKGAWWGTPQIWASTAEEGQRVIRRAGAEAGLDPDQTGEWVFSSSDSPRYGVSLKVRLAEEQGERWVTRREGPSGLPEL